MTDYDTQILDLAWQLNDRLQTHVHELYTRTHMSEHYREHATHPGQEIMRLVYLLWKERGVEGLNNLRELLVKKGQKMSLHSIDTSPVRDLFYGIEPPKTLTTQMKPTQPKSSASSTNIQPSIHGSQLPNLNTESDQQKAEDRQCKICYSTNANVVYTNCGHLCACDKCASSPAMESCPLCRKAGPHIKVYT
uniref:C3HC4 type zinc finger protein n=1 Tax=Clandestinovirus TaxID=2831644 RepID=A0A8F8KR07_9VIRU|nr:C3HC4 type zinc finger protein [Clandestinovirus]